jgi:cellobiose-specific phosphotransferase system component IIC
LEGPNRSKKFLSTKTEGDYRMRKFMLAIVLSTATALAGCATGVNTISNTTVQQDAQALCNWLPAAGDIAAVIASLVSGGAIAVTATTVAQAICTAVEQAEQVPPTASARLRAMSSPSQVVVNGVVVHRAS